MCQLVVCSALLVAAVLAADSGEPCVHRPRITGLIDGDTPNTDSLPKVAQVYFPCPVAAEDDSYALSIIPSGQSKPADGSVVTLSRLSEKFAEKGGFVYASPDVKSFEEFMGFSPDFVNDKFFPTGHGSVLLYKSGGEELVDCYGSPHADSEDRGLWEYTKGSASRLYGTEPSNDTSNVTASIANWFIKKGQVQNGDSAVALGVSFVEFESCSNFPCPEGRRLEGNLTCSKRFCTELDCTSCCTEASCKTPEQRAEEQQQSTTPSSSSPASTQSPATTSGTPAPGSCGNCGCVSCPPGTVIRPNPEGILCFGGACNDLDMKTCCQEASIPPPTHDKSGIADKTGNNSMPWSAEHAKDAQMDNVEFVGSLLGVRLASNPMTAYLAPILLAAFLAGGLAVVAKAAHRQRCPQSPAGDSYYPAMATVDPLTSSQYDGDSRSQYSRGSRDF